MTQPNPIPQSAAPLAPPRAHSSVLPVPSASALEPPVNSRVLIIDDTPAIHGDFRKILCPDPTTVLDEAERALFGSSVASPRTITFALDSAYQGQEGVEMLGQALADGRRYALAFVDVRMPPGWDGVETISRLWAVDPDLQVVICTAFSDYSWPDITQCFGATDKLVILKKPFDNIEVLQLAHALVRKWQLTQDSRLRLEELDGKVAERTLELRRAADHALRLNRLYSVLSKSNELIVQTRSMQELCREACRIAVKDGLFRMAWVGRLQPDSRRVEPVAYWGSSGTYVNQVRVSADADIPEGRGPGGTALREGRSDVCNAVAEDARMAPWQKQAAAHGYRSVGAFPLKVKNRIMGVLALYSEEAGFFNNDEITLLERLAADLSLAFEFIDQTLQIELQRAALESAANSVLITDPQGMILWYNAAFNKLTGYSTGELVGKKTNVLKSGKHTARFYEELWKEVRAGQVWRGEVINRRKDGSLYNEEMTITPVLDAQGVITHFVAIKQDITERKRAELRVAAFSSLGQRLSTAKTVQEAAQIVVDVADQLLGWDACFCDLYAQSEDLVSPVLALDLVNGQRCQLAPAAQSKPPSPVVRRVIREGGILRLRDPLQPLSEGADYFGDLNRASASLLWVPIRHGRTVIGILSIQSYTAGAYNQQSLETLQALADHCAGALERIRAEGSLHMTQEQLRQSQKLEAIGQLAGGVAHDFNNLLAVIRGNAELVLMDADSSSPANDCLNQVVAAADRAAHLTRQLLAFSRKQIMQTEALDLNEVVGNLTKMLRRIIGEHIQLECRYAAHLPFVRADAGMLEQVLVNLVVNARDAMPQGGQLIITTEAVDIDFQYTQQHAEARPGHFVSLAVKDNGSGIAAEHLPHIFEPFFTTKELGKGTGLGLATVYGIVKQHGGWIEAASQPGAGSTFTMFLPVTEAAPAPASDAKDQARPLRGTETILLVEDEDTVRALTRRVLETYGYRVHEATSGAQALELCSSEKPRLDLLLTDVIMPGGVTGRDLADRLIAQNPSLKVIFTSGYSGEILGHDTSFIRRTYGDFLPKPCAPRDLLNAVRQSLDQPARSEPQTTTGCPSRVHTTAPRELEANPLK